MRNLYIDFEFSVTSARWVELICVSVKWQQNVQNFNLRDRQGKQQFMAWMMSNVPLDTCIVSYGIDAEVRALMSLYRVNTVAELPWKKYICLFREHKLLANRCVHTTWGTLINSAGKTFKRPFRGGDREEEKESKKYINLLNALWKFCQIHSEEHARYKDMYRDMCIRNNPVELDRNMAAIMEYCEMDVEQLPALHKAMTEELQKRTGNSPMLISQQLFRGWYASVIAQKTQQGYYVDYTAWVNLEASRERIIREMAEEINRLFPELQPFGWSAKDNRHILNSKKVQGWIDENTPLLIKNIIGKTAKEKKWKLQKDILERIYSGVKHNLPEDDLLAQLYRWLQLSSSMRGLDSRPSKGAKKLGDFLDRREGVVRPYFNDYGTQTGRSAPSSNGYLLLMPPWIRSLLVPPTNHFMVSMDYGKQEVLYLAVMAQDQELINAYGGGDPYASFGRDVGILKDDMDSVTWSLYRQACKQVVLSVIYGITGAGLSVLLSKILKRAVSRGEAEKYLALLRRRYPRAMQWLKEMVREYGKRKRLELPDGWAMWGGNTNERSVGNWRIQAGCGYVMRLVDFYAGQEGVNIPMTLHDGFYFYVPADNPLDDVGIVLRAMHRAFVEGANCLPGSDLITVDIGIYGEGAEALQANCVMANERRYKIGAKKTRYIDDRGIDDLQRYGGYLWPQLTRRD